MKFKDIMPLLKGLIHVTTVDGEDEIIDIRVYDLNNPNDCPNYRTLNKTVIELLPYEIFYDDNTVTVIDVVLRN